MKPFSKNRHFTAAAVTFIALNLISLLEAKAQTPPITIAAVSNIDFGTAPQGDPPKTVVPGTAETATNGSFLCTGKKNMTYSIVLPASPIDMITGAGGANQTISVSSFVSFPATNGRLSNSNPGTQLLLVGATRAALGLTQAIGNYTGSYTVTVVY